MHKIIYREGEGFPQKSIDFAKWARTSQTEKTINASVSLFKDFSEVRLPMSCVDANLFLVGIDGARQVIDLKTGVVRPATRNDYVTKSLNATALGQAKKAVRWLLFLEEVFAGDHALINWLQRWCGYMLTGSTEEQFFVFCYGHGANGKSVLAAILRYIIGDYARVTSSETLTESRRAAGSAATPDLADLIGARLVISTEIEENVALAEGMVKEMTGGDTMSARKLYGNPFQFTPQFKLMMLGNHKPFIRVYAQ